MKVKVRYFAGVREMVGRSEETFEVPEGATVRDLLGILSEKYGAPIRDYVFAKSKEEISPNLNFLVDGKNIVMINGTETPLYDGCAFAIIPPVGGGIR